ncbi:MAG: YaaR family protein [Candidatus Sericytochromatia bacterium]|nr:YaaR family protein [Candidatus Sericytochromatia bacterium]
MLSAVDLAAHPAIPAPRASEGNVPAAEVNGAKFATQMQTARHTLSQATMVAVLAEIEEQGKRLRRHPVAGEVARYRELVGKFLKEASEQFSGAEQHTDRRNRVFTLIREVDQQLAELTQMLLNGQSKPLELLEKLEAIRGMLVDLLI